MIFTVLARNLKTHKISRQNDSLCLTFYFFDCTCEIINFHKSLFYFFSSISAAEVYKSPGGFVSRRKDYNFAITKNNRRNDRCHCGEAGGTQRVKLCSESYWKAGAVKYHSQLASFPDAFILLHRGNNFIVQQQISSHKVSINL